jgi:feruloyl-CoA synthase
LAAVTALAPLAQDIVIAGHSENEVRFLVFPNIAACRALSGLPDTVMTVSHITPSRRATR